ncbi:MAG: peptidoglycan bridge formation glycyltransferase FemA/FemB family protein [Candidatus Pacebacteria bacterium]|nr:peptidoglycan bridge formation glycyltransferase FemA/FemB family protein [Candidatus Paceibacterota bacterium]
MLIRPIRSEEKDLYNQVVNHPLQSWQWGEFRQKTGLKVARVGFFKQGQLYKGLTVTFHPLPLINKNVGYCPKGFMPDEEQLAVLKQLAEQHQALFIKLEPNIGNKVGEPSAHEQVGRFLLANDATPGRPLFTKYTFQVDLTQSEDKLFANLASKTRYNVRLARKKGVQIFENTSKQGMNQYLEILQETIKRQGFYAHTPEYFQTMWQELGDSGMLRIFHAVYQNNILASWVMFLFNNVLYYPYGASRNMHREVMASNLMMWEMIRFGKEQNCTKLDMWGSLGPKPNENHPWYGFHRFKRGYGGDLIEFLGTYDLVANWPMYKLFRIAENLRWKLLRLKTKLRI